MSIRVPRKTKEALDQLARINGVTLNGYLTILLRDHVHDHKNELANATNTDEK